LGRQPGGALALRPSSDDGLAIVFGLLRKVKHAIVASRLRRDFLPVAGPERIDAELDALDAQLNAVLAELFELTGSGRDRAELDEAIAHVCARAEEWTI
jgi:hypothetical protein